MEHDDELYLTDLVDVEILQKLQDAFSEMTGMAALTTDKYGMPVTQGSNFTDFCMKYTRETPLGYSRCMRCDKTGAELTMKSKKTCSYYCHAGLVDFAAPIIANGQMVGSFIGGQVLPAPPNMTAFEEIAQELGIDPQEYKEAVSRVKIVSKEKIDRSAESLRVIADCFSHLAYQSYELHRSNVEIEKASNMKSDFLANMSHEIRTPMNAVLGMTDLALREEMSPAAKDYIHQIKASAKNLLVIINDILDFSKIESGKMDIINVAHEPLSVVNDLASIANSRIGNKDIEFTMDIEPDMPQTVFGDNIRIHQILLNLITNAVKFTQRGEVHLRIRCIRESDEKVIMKAAVSDTGIGIKEENLKKLFHSFQQVDSKRNRNIEGTGLGLAISKQLLELMGGNISVSSEYGKGSTFFFKVPLKIIDKTPAIPKLERN
ncbi:MAG: PocR ligand-binding domain-containing protein, partial [Porcipelethomonas sp.]